MQSDNTKKEKSQGSTTCRKANGALIGEEETVGDATADPLKDDPAPAADADRPVEVRAFASQHPMMIAKMMRVLGNGGPQAATKLLQRSDVLMALLPRFYPEYQAALFGLHQLPGAALQALQIAAVAWAVCEPAGKLNEQQKLS